MIDREFEEQTGTVYCDQCYDRVKGLFTKSVVTLPKSLVIVVDREDENGNLTKLISNYPETIEIDDQNFVLTGFISQDPIFLDYVVSLKDEGRGYWTSFSKRGIMKYQGSTPHNVQIFMYMKVE
jgi:uncharacterized UBP type Zn finger protein